MARDKDAFDLAEEYVDDVCSIDPVMATELGVGGSDHLWGHSFGLEGISSSAALRARYRARLSALAEPDSEPESRAVRVMGASFDEDDRSDDAGDHFRSLRHMASPFQVIRTVFDVMPVSTEDEVGNIVARLRAISGPLDDFRELLSEGIARGITVARRQVVSVAEQAKRQATDPSGYGAIAERVAGAGHDPDAVADAAVLARDAVGEFGRWLETDYLPHAITTDAVGPEVYGRWADRLVGLDVDLENAYRWGWEEFGRIRDEMARIADQISPGDSVEAVASDLETGPDFTVSSTGALIEFVTGLLSNAVEELSGTHFEVPELIRDLTVQLAPPGSPLGVYYMRPSEDFSRPGGIWYSIGDQETFPLYQHVSTAYHEGFPGHHLQIATAMLPESKISRFQKALTWYPGYGEGWGMYAEVLMGELGYLDDPAHYFGMLAKQLYRAARVVVDIGLHLELRIDTTSPLAPGEPWGFDTAVKFMEIYGSRTPAQARDEVLRYLGWPGQAISYKLGEREILDIRRDQKARLGEAFDLKDFHSTVLRSGPMRLDLLREVVAGRDG